MEEDLKAIWKKRPLIISGPCSAETEEQVLETARQLAATGKVDMLRAGIWKPRTKPGMFEGAGEPGLEWLVKAKAETGLPLAIEVANTQHVQLAVKYGIDVVWIGARTTVNPFSVQEIAEALAGTGIPVLIKNPINPDIELWSGAVERLLAAGVKDIGLIHRGFSLYGQTEYRNAPMWQLAIEMKRRFPGMLLLCDPSHICGNRTMLQDVAQESIDLEYGGIMIESHIDPDNAWSDAKQQITPAQFGKMIDALVWRKKSDLNPPTELALMRQNIDRVDDELLSLLSQRMKIADLIGKYKKQNNITILQTDRWSEMLERAIKKGEALLLSKEFLVKYLDAVHMESINHQNKVMNDEKKNSL